MEAMGMMRDLDQIRERDDAREGARTVAIALGGLAAACVLFAVGVMIGREGEAQRPVRRDDPLARLDALAGQVASAAPPSVTYPGRLSENAPSAGAAPSATAEASANAAPTGEAVAGALLGAGASTANAGAGPAPSGRTAAVPASAFVANVGVLRDNPGAPAALPVAGLNQARLGVGAAGPLGTGAPAREGTDGAITLQVSAFRALGTAQAFATRLRDRGYRSFVASAPPQAGTGAVWHRVRIGPFTTLREANLYRAQFEARERLPTYVVRRDAEEHGGH